jgi:hypothetical protein
MRASFAPLNLGYLLSEDPNRSIRFTCRAETCRNKPPVDKPLGDMCVGLGEEKLLGDIKARCTWCGRSDRVEVSVWKDTWSGPK